LCNSVNLPRYQAGFLALNSFIYMANTIKLKKSSVSGKVPGPADLVHGELAINYSDGVLYYKTNTNQIKSFRSNVSTIAHSELSNLFNDDHSQYVHTTLDRTITANHTFGPLFQSPPFNLGTNAIGQLIAGLNADLLDGKHASEFFSSDNKPITHERFEFIENQTWTVVHNKNTDKFTEKLIDSSGNQFFAKITVIDNNSFRVNLTYPVSGVVDVFFLP
jgi:hypothetical protein